MTEMPSIYWQNYKFSIHTEPDLGIHIDLIEPEQYEPPENGAEMLPEDDELMADEKKNPTSRSAVEESSKLSAPWLHKTVYYGNDDLYGDQQLNRVSQPIREDEVFLHLLETFFALVHNSSFEGHRRKSSLQRKLWPRSRPASRKPTTQNVL